MGRYIARRLLIAVPTLIVISFVIYAVLALGPIDPLSQFGDDPRVPAEVRERIRESLGLNQPWPIRYVKWMTSMFSGDFGVSFMSHSQVRDLIAQRLPNTLAVVGVAYVLGVLMGIPVGMISAIKRYSLFDHAATTFAFIGFSVPTFFTGLLLLIVFGIKLRWFPFIYSSTTQVHDLDSFVFQIRQSIMPISVLALANVATIARYVRSEMLEHLPLDYVRTARSKGLMERLLLLRHVLRNSLIPALTPVALGGPPLFGGAIVTQGIFRVPWIGELLLASISDRCLPVVASVVFISAILVVLFNLFADVLYAVLDPRIRYT